MSRVFLRDMTEDDLDVLFEIQADDGGSHERGAEIEEVRYRFDGP